MAGLVVATLLFAAVSALLLPSILEFMILLAMGGMLLIVCIAGRDFILDYWKRITGAIGILVLVALISMELVVDLRGLPYDFFNLTSPGTVLPAFLGFVTVVGFTITISRLNETNVRISSYEEFLQRLSRMFRMTILQRGGKLSLAGFVDRVVNIMDRIEIWWKTGGEFADDDHEGLKILCTVPALGNMSHQQLFRSRVLPLWKKLAESNVKVEMLTLDGPHKDVGILMNGTQDGMYEYGPLESFNDLESDDEKRQLMRTLEVSPIGTFYENFASAFDRAEIRRSLIQVFDILWIFRLNKSKQNRVHTFDVRNGQLPPMHLFWTRTRAIVAVPLDRGLRRDLERGVSMIGYETTDSGVIERLLSVYVEWRQRLLDSNALPKPSDGPRPDAPFVPITTEGVTVPSPVTEVLSPDPTKVMGAAPEMDAIEHSVPRSQTEITRLASQSDPSAAPAETEIPHE